MTLRAIVASLKWQHSTQQLATEPGALAMAPAASTLPQTSRIPARFAIPITTDSGLIHFAGDDTYTIAVMLGHRPYTALCGELVRHASPTTRGAGTCARCVAVADRFGLRRSDRRVDGPPTVGPDL